MNYLKNLSCASLAEHYAKFHNEDALDELKRRDKLVANDKGETYKYLFASPYHIADTSSVESLDRDETRTLLWDAYEAGCEAGKKVGEKTG